MSKQTDRQGEPSEAREWFLVGGSDEDEQLMLEAGAREPEQVPSSPVAQQPEPLEAAPWPGPAQPVAAAARCTRCGDSVNPGEDLCPACRQAPVTLGEQPAHQGEEPGDQDGFWIVSGPAQQVEQPVQPSEDSSSPVGQPSLGPASEELLPSPPGPPGQDKVVSGQPEGEHDETRPTIYFEEEPDSAPVGGPRDSSASPPSPGPCSAGGQIAIPGGVRPAPPSSRSGARIVRPADTAAFLVVVRTPRRARRGQIIPLREPRTIIGRGRTATCFLEDPQIDPSHGEVNYESRPEGLAFWVYPVSEKGLVVNGHRVREGTRLNSGDRLRVGDTELVFFQVELQ